MRSGARTPPVSRTSSRTSSRIWRSLAACCCLLALPARRPSPERLHGLRLYKAQSALPRQCDDSICPRGRDIRDGTLGRRRTRAYVMDQASTGSHFPGNLLIVEDEKLLALMLEDLLLDAGHRVVHAGSVTDAL